MHHREILIHKGNDTNSYDLLVVSDSQRFISDIVSWFIHDQFVSVHCFSSITTIEEYLNQQGGHARNNRPVVILASLSSTGQKEMFQLIKSSRPETPFLIVAPDESQIVPSLISNGAIYLSYSSEIPLSIKNELCNTIRNIAFFSEHSKATQTEIDESPKLMLELLDSIPAPVFVNSEDCKIIECNSAFEQYIGKLREEIIGTSIYSLFDKDLADFSYDMDLKITDTKHIKKMSLSVRFDGISGMLLLHKSVYYHNGVLKGFVGMLQEFSGLLLSTSASIERERVSKEIVDFLGDIICRLTIDGRIKYVNNAGKLTGYKMKDAIGVYYYSFFHPDDIELIKREFEEVAVGDFPYGKRLIAKMRMADGTYLPCEIRLYLWQRDEGLRDVILFARDISDRLDAEEEVRNLASLISDTIAYLDDLVLIHDKDGKYLPFMQPLLADRLVVPPEEIVGKRWTDLPYPDSVNKAYLDAYWKLLETEIPQEITYSLVQNNVERYYNTKLTLRKDSLGNNLGSTDIIREITEQVMSEKIIKMANKKLSLFQSITRHDLLNILNSLDLLLGLIERKCIDPVCIDYVNKAKESVVKMDRIVTFSRDFQDIGTEGPIWVNLTQVIADAFEELNPKGIQLQLPSPEVEILTDPLLVRVFYNLMENSIRHGGKVTKISVEGKGRGNSMYVIYKDNGNGISESEKSFIFEKGYGKNTGLGLFVIREILMITGITIKENGKEGEGVRFEMLIPSGFFRCR